MNDFKEDVSEFFGRLTKKGAVWFSQFWNTTDHTISKVSLFLQEKKRELDEYLIDRRELLSKISDAEREVDQLQEQIGKAYEMQTEDLLKLYEKLEKRTEALMEHQHALSQLEETIDSSHDQISALSHEKEQVIIERNWLKSEYDHLQQILNANHAKQAQLQEEIKQLKIQQGKELTSDQEVDVLVEQEILEKEAEIKRLQGEKNVYSLKFEALKKELMVKVSEVAKLSQELQAREKEVENQEQQVILLKESLDKQFIELKEERKRSEVTRKHARDIEHSLQEKNQAYKAAERRLNKLKGDLEEQAELYVNEMESAEQRMAQLQADLAEEQQILGDLRAEQGSPAKVSTSEKRILSQEYEPRFATLYRDCSFHEGFFKDFFMLLPSERLQVEACIVNLNHFYESHSSKIRPNTVKTNSGLTINEYPFGRGNTGRIYFKEKEERIHIYRLSRTKNGRGKLDQKKVIEWLRKNY